MTDKTSITLSPAAQRFVLHWGEMGARWGVNRSVAQIHALLYIADRPLHAEEIAGALGVARSNVSASLKELQSWRLARTVHVLGDRRDHFATLDDVWEMFRIVLDERKRREIDPTVALLRECVAEAKRSGGGSGCEARRLADMLEFFETGAAWYGHVRALPVSAWRRLLKLGARLRKLVA